MGERDDPHFVGLDLINDAVREAPKWKSSRAAAPHRAKAWVIAEDADGAFELCDERKSELGIRFSRVEEGSVDQLALSF
jgi:hypothetical protein